MPQIGFLLNNQNMVLRNCQAKQRNLAESQNSIVDWGRDLWGFYL